MSYKNEEAVNFLEYNSQREHLIIPEYGRYVQKLIDQIKKFANTSIDISDGLIADLDKMINNQKLSYKIFLFLCN